MPTPRDIRELALQALYELDARQGDDAALHLSTPPVPMSDEQRTRAFDTARSAYAMRKQADDMASELAPTWPTARQPAVDRAIIRLAWCEMATGLTPPKVAVNEAIELAKRYSTEKSPAFINGVLDKMMRRIPTPTPGSVPGSEPPADPWLHDAVTPTPDNAPPIDKDAKVDND